MTKSVNIFRLSAQYRPSSRNRAKRGVTAVEFALIAPALFIFLIGITEITLLMLAEHIIENATYNASRTAKTGYVAEDKTQEETVRNVLLARLAGLNPLIDVAKVSMTSVAYADLSDIGQPGQGEVSLGKPAQIVVYTISYPWKFFTPLIGEIMGDEHNIMNLTSRIVVRNEPYD
ncbi:MAG: pilus assembly protein [Alphaproteobacteria bacterium]|nr:pilus assembly protein [Alphaproteobacteria bacterium]